MKNSRPPIRALGVSAARAVRKAIGYDAPTDLPLETLAFMRGALVRSSPATGARANLVRVGAKGVIGVAAGLSDGERRWAIAHELGHFEAHANVSFMGLCSGDDLFASYEASGREPEANAFAAELLMPEDLFAPHCDPALLSWDAIRPLADTFQVSLTAAALRLIAFTSERAAIVCAKDGVVVWSSATKDFGPRPPRGARIEPWTEARAFFDGRDFSGAPEQVTASAWVPGAEDDLELTEHLLAMPALGVTVSLLRWPP